ncbi:MAG TPA: DUF4402 domain-containing protein [Longimicrobiales bacterium]|nr:DUF4402 domain-containing protein [Longimicrobiales bacterium]
MSAHRMLRSLAIWCALTAVGAPLSAQLSVLPGQGLAFGQLQVGVPTNVPPTDATRRAEYDVTGNGTYVLDFILPANLVSGTGALLPVTFPTNAGLVVWRTLPLQFSFNPNNPYTLWLPWLIGGASVYLGGTAHPSPTQAPGYYTATITLMIANGGF